MKKKIIFLFCVIGLVINFALLQKLSVNASYDDAPHAETSLPTNN